MSYTPFALAPVAATGGGGLDTAAGDARYVVRGSSRATAAAAGGALAHFDDFSLHTDGNVHGKLSHGDGAYDPSAWIDALTYVGAGIEPFVESAYIVNGVLRHRGTRTVASAAQPFPLPGGRSHIVTMGYVEEDTNGPGGGYPALGLVESEYASTRASFVDGALSNGYVGYVFQTSNASNHFFRIVRDDSSIPTPIVDDVDVGRRLTPNDSWSFRHDDNRFTILLNGIVMTSVVETTHSYTTFDGTSIVLNTESLTLPGVPWWSIAIGSDFTPNIRWDSASRASTSFSLTGTGGSWVDVTNALDLSVPAHVGDIIQVNTNFFRTDTASNYLDIAVIDGSGTPIRYISSGTATPKAEGISGLYPGGVNYTAYNSGLNLVVTDADLIAGAVNFRLRYRNPGGPTGTLYADSTYPFNWSAVNLGAAS